MGGPHGGGGRHGTPLRLGTRSRHGRRAPRGAPLHGGRQRQIRGSVPSHGARVLEVRIHLPPAESRANFCTGTGGLGIGRRLQRADGTRRAPIRPFSAAGSIMALLIHAETCSPRSSGSMTSATRAWAHQEKDITDPKEAQQNLVGWITGLKVLTEAS